MAADDSKSYLFYLNKLVDEYNNSYHYSIGKKPKFKVGDRVRITNYTIRLFLAKVILKNGQNDSVLKSNPWTYKIKNLNDDDNDDDDDYHNNNNNNNNNNRKLL